MSLFDTSSDFSHAPQAHDTAPPPSRRTLARSPTPTHRTCSIAAHPAASRASPSPCSPLASSTGSCRPLAETRTAPPADNLSTLCTPRWGDLSATNRSNQLPTTTWKRQMPGWKLHVHTWQWHLSDVSLPATDPRTAWHLRCEKQRQSTSQADYRRRAIAE